MVAMFVNGLELNEQSLLKTSKDANMATTGNSCF
jgi:hypothetical protein